MKKYLIYFTIALICFILAFVAPWFFTQLNYKEFGINTGFIGDTIGGLTAPFLSIAGSVLVFAALKAQIDANKQVQKQFEKQEKENAIRDFSSVFFQMLNIHHNLVTNMMMPHKYLFADIPQNQRSGFTKLQQNWVRYNGTFEIQELNGRDLFEKSFYQLNEYLRIETPSLIAMQVKNLANSSPFDQKQEMEKILKPGYDFFYSKLSSNYGNYFRNLYRIIKQIDEFQFDKDSLIDFEKKYYYTSIVRAQLSDSEVKWLMFNGLSKYGEKFKKYIEKYSLLKVLDTKDNGALETYKALYDVSAFKKN